MGHKEKLKCHKLFLKIYDETNHNAESGKFENLRTNITNKNIDIRLVELVLHTKYCLNNVSITNVFPK